MILPLDLSVPSFRSAHQLARAVVMSGDRRGGERLMARLLWLVPAHDGGFIGLDDYEFDQRVDRYVADGRFTRADVIEFMWAPGEWPVTPAAARAA